MRTLTTLAVASLLLVLPPEGGSYNVGAKAGSYNEAANSIIALPEPNSPFVAFNIWIKSGSASDPKGKEGLASLTASLLSGGATKQDTLEAILERMYRWRPDTAPRWTRR